MMTTKRSKKPPANPETGEVAKFGFDLRTLRQGVGKTYAQAALDAHYSKSAVYSADQGHTLPSRDLTKAFVSACGGDAAEWVARRDRLAKMLDETKQSAPKETPKALGQRPPDPRTATTAEEFSDLLKGLIEWSGSSFRELSRISGSYQPPLRPLPPSTLCNALRRGTLPTRTVVESLVHAVGVEQADWLLVWDALKNGRPVPRLPPWRRAKQRITRRRYSDPRAAVQPTIPVVPAAEIRDWVRVGQTWVSTDDLARRTLSRDVARRSVYYGAAMGVVVVITVVVFMLGLVVIFNQ